MSRKKVSYYANKPKMFVVNDGVRMDLNSIRGFSLGGDEVSIIFKDDTGEKLTKTFDDKEQAQKYLTALDKYYGTIFVEPKDDEDDD